MTKRAVSCGRYYWRATWPPCCLQAPWATPLSSLIPGPWRLGGWNPDARKLIHTFSAPLFLALWPLFSAVPAARIVAAIVPVLNAVRLSLASSWSNTSKTSGSKKNDERALAAAVSRSGDAKEAAESWRFVYCAFGETVSLALWLCRRWRPGTAWPI